MLTCRRFSNFKQLNICRNYSYSASASSSFFFVVFFFVTFLSPFSSDDFFFALREREAHKDKLDWHTFGELCFNSDKEVIENILKITIRKGLKVKQISIGSS